ncbi:MAG: DUF2784 domain-containing protein [Sulfuritalea sp.]|nr:DUF2784 domain-containing protein [Sulfuritalea sp.]
MERIAADFLVVLHLGFIIFVGLGALLCLRWKKIVWLHLPAVVWAAAIEFRRGICPLTPLEQQLRLAAGEAGYSGSFIEHYLLPVIYPAGLDATFQYILGTLVILVNLVTYGWVVFLRYRRGSNQ